MASTELSAGLGTPITPSTGQPGIEPGRARDAAARTGVALGRLFAALRSNRKASAGAILLAFVVILAAVPGLIAHDPPRDEIYGRSLGPSSAHLFGTTVYGQDIFSQFIWGARETLIIAVVGGVADSGLNLVTDTLLVIPSFPLLLIIAAYLPNSGVAVLIAILVITGYSYGARQLRAQALSLRRRDYLEAARVRGERTAYIIAVEIIPNMTPLIVASFLGTAVYNVLFSAGLQFIGFGNPNSVSWGTMLYWAQNNEALSIGQYLWALMPGLGIATLGAAFALLNYAFDEIGNPALRPVRRHRVKRAR